MKEIIIIKGNTERARRHLLSSLTQASLRATVKKPLIPKAQRQQKNHNLLCWQQPFRR